MSGPRPRHRGPRRPRCCRGRGPRRRPTWSSMSRTTFSMFRDESLMSRRRPRGPGPRHRGRRSRGRRPRDRGRGPRCRGRRPRSCQGQGPRCRRPRPRCRGRRPRDLVIEVDILDDEVLEDDVLDIEDEVLTSSTLSSMSGTSRKVLEPDESSIWRTRFSMSKTRSSMSMLTTRSAMSRTRP